MQKKVYIPNKSGHDISGAEEYGEPIFVTEGYINKFNVNEMFRKVARSLENSEEDEFIMITGLTQINAVLAAAFAHKHGRLNMLIFDVKEEEYVPRKLVLDNLIEHDTDKVS